MNKYDLEEPEDLEVDEEVESLFCLDCGREKLPMYEEHPNWILFCPNCDKWVD